MSPRVSTEDLVDLKSVTSLLRLPAESSDMDVALQPRGYRLLSKIPRLPESVVERIVAQFYTPDPTTRRNRRRDAPGTGRESS